MDKRASVVRSVCESIRLGDDMEEFYEKDPEPSPSPPPYSRSSSHASTSSRFNVQPRLEEGRETLPQYSCAISLENVFLKKDELERVVHRSGDRCWKKVCVRLQGTALTMHKCNGSRVLERLAGKELLPDEMGERRRGRVVRSWNLQHAEVGIAADYVKKRFVFRVRAETDQFLLSCVNIETFVLWLQALNAAIDLAPPLDDREIPRDLSIPRARRRRGRPRPVNPLSDPAAEPGLAPVIEITTTPTATLTRAATSTPQSRPRPRPQPVTFHSTPAQERARERRLERDMLAEQRGTRASIDEEGKWRPDSQWSTMHDMIYAKRCMAVLTYGGKRKTDLVVLSGRLWRVNWRTGGLMCCEGGETEDDGRGGRGDRPPGYGEIEGMGRGSWILA